jgi:putative membrane protein
MHTFVISTAGRNLSLDWKEGTFFTKKDFSLCLEMTAFKSAVNFEIGRGSQASVASLLYVPRRGIFEPNDRCYCPTTLIDRTARTSPMLAYFLRAAFAALGLWLATGVVSGLHFNDAQTLVVAALLLGVINAVIRPLVIILTLPITLLSLGLFLLVINAAMLGLVAWLLPGFHVDTFGTAVLTSLIVSLCSWVASALLGNPNVQIKIKRLK